ncbi:Nitrilotriacetate monooxygenase component B [plant metagenome]|uniref:Nitrilotriacetate monooxygenase component B n=1 Tax=plant metagenome TaxID=1297885 RepID=A0A484UY57_9ZZZZ
MTATPTSTDPAHFRTTLGRFATGVTIVTTRDAAGAPAGLTVSSFNSVSLDPPLVLWSLSLTSSSLPLFEQCERYVVNVLAAGQLSLASRFARGTAAERFQDLTLAEAPGGAPMLADPGAAWFECRNRSRYREGDHLILVGEVEHCGYTDAPPLVYHAGGFDLTPALPR